MKIEKVVTPGGMRYPRLDQPADELTYSDPSEIPTGQLPTGRISVDDTTTFTQLMQEFASEFSSVPAKFPLDYLEIMQNLSMVNPDVSQMIDNIVELGNTGHKVVIETENDNARENMLEELNHFAQYGFRKFGGVEGFVNSVLAQIGRSGAASVEWVVGESLDGIDKVAFVPVKSIRFIRDKETGDYVPHQKINDIGQGAKGGLVELNENTYQYCAMQLLDNSPYAVPPILAALEAIMIQRDVMKNFKFVAKKMGLLGFVTFLLKAPARQGGENDTAYYSRLQTFLNTQADVIKHNYRDGMAIGFKDNFEVQHHSLMGSAAGATEIMKEIEQQVFSGLKADPALHGRTYSTTETYAGVVYEKMLSILTNYQRTVRTILEYGYKLHLVLRGFEYDSLYVEFEPSKSLSSERDEATYNQKLLNLELLYNQGIINQEQFAQEAGYETPDSTEPRSVLDDVPEEDDSATESQSAIFTFNRQNGRYTTLGPKKKKKPGRSWAMIETSQEGAVDDLELEYNQIFAQYMDAYHGDCSCDWHAKEQLADTTATGRKLRQYMQQYFRRVFPSVRSSRTEAVKSLDAFLKTLDFTTMDSELFATTVLDHLAGEFGANLQNSPIEERVRQQINSMYRFFRLTDVDLFSDGKSPIKPSFNLVDRNAIRFMRASDNFYFGRYLTDPRTKAQLKKWLENEYLQSGRSLRDPGELAKFRNKFGTRVAREDYKVLRVVETSVTRSKNWGNILQADQAQASLVRISGPNDNLTCPWCQGMVGKEFPVKPVVQQVKDTIDRDPEDLPALNPFLPGRVHPDALPDTSEEQLLAQGIALPPYHPHCRHRFVVKEFV